MLSDYAVTATMASKDMAKARKFYGETLGLKVELDLGDVMGVIYSAGQGSKLFVYESSFAGTNQATSATWNVEKLEELMADLKGKGVTFEEYDFPGLKTVNGMAEFEGEKVAWFKDPDGNIHALAQSSQEKAN